MKIDKSKIIEGNPIPIKRGIGFGSIVMLMAILGFFIIFIKIAPIL